MRITKVSDISWHIPNICEYLDNKNGSKKELSVGTTRFGDSHDIEMIADYSKSKK